MLSAHRLFADRDAPASLSLEVRTHLFREFKSHTALAEKPTFWWAFCNGGESEIRTHGRVAPSTVFKTAALNRSAISPSVSVIINNLLCTYLHHHFAYVKFFYNNFYIFLLMCFRPIISDTDRSYKINIKMRHFFHNIFD